VFVVVADTPIFGLSIRVGRIWVDIGVVGCEGDI
jgi:hypothetical protein